MVLIYLKFKIVWTIIRVDVSAGLPSSGPNSSMNKLCCGSIFFLIMALQFNINIELRRRNLWLIGHTLEMDTWGRGVEFIKVTGKCSHSILFIELLGPEEGRHAETSTKIVKS